MKVFSWSRTKNHWLLEERGIGFERIVLRIEQGGVLDILRHPNPEKYPGQMIFVVELENYAWLVPFVESRTEIFS